MSSDFVDAVVDLWEAELPGERFQALGVVSRLTRYLRLVTRLTTANLERFGLQETQFNLLCALRRAGRPYQLSPKQLSESMLITSGAVTYVIDQMQDSGYVERLNDPQDRRALLVRLTIEGHKRVEDAMFSHLRLCQQLLEPLDATRQQHLADALRSLLIAIDDGPFPVSSKGSAAAEQKRVGPESTVRAPR